MAHRRICNRFRGVKTVACPFFMPVRRMDGSWPHPPRLPLGGGWQGHCTAPGHEGVVPDAEQLQAGCNLGYARDCSWLPPERVCDAVRFSVIRDCGHRVVLAYVCEIRHRPGDHGQLEYNLEHNRWLRVHPDSRIQTMAECVLATHLRKTRPTAAEGADIAHG